MNKEPLKEAAETAIETVTGGLQPIAKTALAKGVRSSEFKMSMVGLGVAVAMGLGTALSVIPGPWSIVGAGLLGGLSVLGYGVSRGLAKVNAAPRSR